MLTPNFAVFLGKEKEGGFSGFVAENNLFLVLEIEEGLDVEEGRNTINIIKEQLLKLEINSLFDFESALVETIKISNLPANFSLAAGILSKGIFYLKTVNQGIVFLNRDKEFAKIISADNAASGLLETNDFFIFTTEAFTKTIGGGDLLRTFLDNKKPGEIVDQLTPQIKGQDDRGLVALFTRFVEEEKEEGRGLDETLFVSRPKLWEKILTNFSSYYKDLKARYKLTSQRKLLTLIGVILIFVILIWSVGLGVKRRNEQKIKQRIADTRQLIIQKLDQAEEVSFLNLPRALILISESKIEVNNLKKNLGKNYADQIAQLNKLIADKENKFIKKEEKSYQEFFDLTVDEKQAQGYKFYLNDDNLVILDTKNSQIYLLSLSQKSLDKKKFPEIKSASLVVNYQDQVFFFNQDGIYRIDVDNKLKKIINKDKDWGEIIDFWIYNGNVYLLDKTKDEVYKYLVATDGYSAKSSYFKSGQGTDLSQASSLAIDSSVYIGLQDLVLKYTAGERDGFKTSFPDENVDLTKIFTNKDTEKVYGWDKSKGIIYVLGKDGSYERQINSAILSKGNDFIVYDKNAYILQGSKIYEVSLD